MIAILSSILSGMLAGEVLYRFVDEEHLLAVTGLNFLLIPILGLIYGLLNENGLFIIVSCFTSISMIIYVIMRVYK